MPDLSPELISGLIAFLLTVFVLSYLINDNFLFRAATYIFVGVSAGYVAAVAWPCQGGLHSDASEYRRKLPFSE